MYFLPHLLQHITVGPMSSKQVSQSARLTAEQPAVVAPELSKETEQPIPYVEQAAATGPDLVGAEDPQNDTPRIKKTLFEKIVSVFKK